LPNRKRPRDPWLDGCSDRESANAEATHNRTGGLASGDYKRVDAPAVDYSSSDLGQCVFDRATNFRLIERRLNVRDFVWRRGGVHQHRFTATLATHPFHCGGDLLVAA
jgi:hypothetical protein